MIKLSKASDKENLNKEWQQFTINITVLKGNLDKRL